MKIWQSILVVVLVVAHGAFADATNGKDEKAAESSVPESPTEQARLSVDEILNRDPELDDYVESERCIRRSSIRRTEVLDERHVSVQVSRDEFYIVQFKHRCPGMRRGNPVLLETRSTKLCKHDTLRPLENWGGGMRPGVRCPIPEFQSVTREQLLHLKDSLKTQKRKKKA
ncbi:MAG: hypothetical protein GKR90_22990 [Pseudomonadales bacterium]|nr:hypothetical protein [Pseudomonadales bacterium]